MKKVLVSLLVLALAMSSVFAAVNFSGEFKGGYQFQYKNDAWTGHVQGQDGDDTNTTKLNLGIADDNGVWSVGIEGALVADGRVTGDISIDMIKLFGIDSDLSVKFGLAANDEQTVLRAYANPTGKNLDRIRTSAAGVWANVAVGYGDYVTVQVAGSPKTAAVADGGDVNPSVGGTGKYTGFGACVGDLAISALGKPMAGLEISAGWVLKGDGQNNSGDKGAFTAAVDANVGAMAELGFDLGVSASYIYGIDPKNHVVSAAVYGGVDMVDAYVEYSYNTVETADRQNFLAVGANFNLVENMLLDVYFGSNKLSTFADNLFVGGDIGYTVNNVTFALGVEYSAGAKSLKYDNTGLVIVPTVGVSF